MKEIERPLIIFDYDGVIVERGFIFKKDAKLFLALLKDFGFDVGIVTSRGWFLYLLAIAWDWLNNVDISIEKSGPNGNKAKYCRNAYMFVDNTLEHIINVLKEGNVEKVCFFSKNKEVKIDTEKNFYVVSDWLDIIWEVFT